MSKRTKTVLITGASSGVGFEAARLMGLDPSIGAITLGVRSEAKGRAARAKLAQLCDCAEERFDVWVADVGSMRSTRDALRRLFETRPDARFDYLLLNAGRVGGVELERTEDGIDVAYAATLVGHHIMTVEMLERGALPPGATVVIAGAEAARGNIGGMKLRDVNALAEEHYDADLVRATTALLRAEAPGKYDARGDLATLKAFAAWWAAAMARDVDERGLDVKVFAVSPGGTPDTNGPRYLPLPMRALLKLLSPVFKLAGQAHTIGEAAKRYLDILTVSASDSGRFFASPLDKGIGPLTDNTVLHEHFRDAALQDAVLASLEALTGTADSRPATDEARASLPHGGA